MADLKEIRLVNFRLLFLDLSEWVGKRRQEEEMKKRQEKLWVKEGWNTMWQQGGRGFNVLFHQVVNPCN
jgi:hypothetical protein